MQVARATALESHTQNIVYELKYHTTTRIIRAYIRQANYSKISSIELIVSIRKIVHRRVHRRPEADAA
jgi:hypothetical protein